MSSEAGTSEAAVATADVPPFRYTAALADQIELAWQDRWEREGTFNVPNPVGPLSQGFVLLPVGSTYSSWTCSPTRRARACTSDIRSGFIGTDVFARYERMRGDNVLHTMGFDAFGLPAEQYAVQTGQHPAATTYSRIDVFKRQLRRMGLGHDQRRVFATTDKRYYRWTQWIFLQIFNSFYDS